MNIPETPRDSHPRREVTNSVASNETTRVTRGRRLSDIKLAADLTREQVVTMWGPPDGHRGSGLDYLMYTLEDGQELWLLFGLEPPFGLRAASLVSPEGGHRKNLFQKDQCANQ